MDNEKNLLESDNELEKQEKNFLDFLTSDKPYEPTIIEKRYNKAKKNFWKYYEIERRAGNLKRKWQTKLNYYEKKFRNDLTKSKNR